MEEPRGDPAAGGAVPDPVVVDASSRPRFLAAASALLAGASTESAVLERLARLAVPALAAWCAVDLVEEGGLRRALVHADPARAAGPNGPSGPPQALEATLGVSTVLRSVPTVFRTGRAVLYPEVTERHVRAAGPTEGHVPPATGLPPRSAMIVPLRGRDRTLGALTLVAAPSGRRFTEDDLVVAEELARRAALALEDARLLRDLERRDRRFEELLDSLDAIAWVAEVETGRFVSVSRAAERLLGRPLARWLADPRFFASIVHPEDRERALAARRLAAATGRADVEYRIVAGDGRAVWVRDLVEAVRDASGTPRHLRGVTIDVTHRVVAEQGSPSSAPRARSSPRPPPSRRRRPTSCEHSRRRSGGTPAPSGSSTPLGTASAASPPGRARVRSSHRSWRSRAPSSSRAGSTCRGACGRRAPSPGPGTSRPTRAFLALRPPPAAGCTPPWAAPSSRAGRCSAPSSSSPHGSGSPTPSSSPR